MKPNLPPLLCSAFYSATFTAFFFGACVFLEHIFGGPLPIGEATLPVLGASTLGAVSLFAAAMPLSFFGLPRSHKLFQRYDVFLWRVSLLGVFVGLAAIGMLASLDPSRESPSSALYRFFGLRLVVALGLGWVLVRRSPKPTRQRAILLCCGYAALLLWLSSVPPFNSQHQPHNTILLGFIVVSLSFGFITEGQDNRLKKRVMPALLGLFSAFLGAFFFVLRYRNDFNFRDLAVRGGHVSRTILEHITPIIIPSGSLSTLITRAEPEALEPLGQELAAEQDLLKALYSVHPTNIVWVTVDTLRADLGGINPPAFDRLTQESVHFTSFYSSATSTRAALQGFFLGWVGWMSDPPSKNLFERFHQHGFRTLGILGTAYPTIDEWTKHGFDVLLYPSPEESEFSATQVNEHFFHQLKNGEKKPFLAWLHYMEPHAPYNGQGTPLERYCSEIYLVDQALNSLLQTLKKDGLLENTMVIVTADHGEEFLEHGGMFHGTNVFNETIKIPLWIRTPDGALHGEITSPFSAIYLGSMVLAFGGISETLSKINSLDDLFKKPVFSFQAPYIKGKFQDGLSCVIYGNYKFTYNLQMRDATLYDLSKDPLEKNNLIEQDKEITATLATLLNLALQSHGLVVD
jgi:hypothetical protein